MRAALRGEWGKDDRLKCTRKRGKGRHEEEVALEERMRDAWRLMQANTMNIYMYMQSI